MTPRFSRHARVCDAMRHGVLSCRADATVRDAARTMSTHHVHTVVVNDPGNGALTGIVTDRALVGALQQLGGGDRRLADIVDTNPPTISSEGTLAAAAELMHERAVSHLVVVDAHSGRPTGMLSTLDLAGILAWCEA